MRSLWPDADFDDPDWEWHSAANDSPGQLLALWQDAVERSRAAVTAVLADGDLGQLVRRTGWDDPPSLRRVLIDIIEEYARHVVTPISSASRSTGSPVRTPRADAGVTR